MMNSSTCDAVVIGAGIVGCATAYALAKSGLTVTLLDKGQIGGAVSGASLACLSAHMIDSEELPLLKESCAFWSTAEEELGSDLEYNRCGQLRFVTEEPDIPVAKAWLEVEQAAGLPVKLLSPAEVTEIAPALQGRIAAATWSPKDATVNPFLSCRAFIAAARGLGVMICPDSPAVAIECAHDRVEAVRTPNLRIATNWVINAAGPWAREIASMVSIRLPILPRKAQCLATIGLPPVIPCVVGACESGGGVEEGYTQIQQARSGQVLFNTVSGATERLPGAQDSDFTVSHDFVLDSVRTLLWLFPSLANVSLLRSWVRYEAVTPDDRFIVGPVPGIDGFIMAAGDCGTGFTRAPIIGRLIATLIETGKPDDRLFLYAADRFPASEVAA